MYKLKKSFAIGGFAVVASVLAFAVTSIAANTVTYRNLATGFCLDSGSDQKVYTNGCNGGSYQKWTVGSSGNARIFRNVATGFCLDSNAAQNVYTHGCNGGSYQKWQ